MSTAVIAEYANIYGQRQAEVAKCVLDTHRNSVEMPDRVTSFGRNFWSLAMPCRTTKLARITPAWNPTVSATLAVSEEYAASDIVRIPMRQPTNIRRYPSTAS